MNAPAIQFSLNGSFRSSTDSVVTGEQTASVTADGHRIEWLGDEYDELVFTPAEEGASFDLDNVVIGVNFHWERKERQRFGGSLKLIVEDGGVTAVNVIGVEDYLRSVISSEMSATASLELLKAHAVISRSWLLAQINPDKHLNEVTVETDENSDDEYIRWYDRDDHKNFDVCADDHCQRYQGMTRQTTPQVDEAIRQTCGEVLMYDGELCDARFSKCCGGVFEEFENCWEPVHHPYLEARSDSRHEDRFPDLTVERNAEEWILSRPEAFCNTADATILGQVLNNYDQETTDFYRWRVEYTREQLADLIRRRSGIDFGDIRDLIPVARGTSGRLYKLEIAGTKRTMVIGKELEIRRTLSESHLYSSAFIVERKAVDPDGIPSGFVLHGAGWGHGVGLCQIGAAVMGAQGYDYRSILLHYFVNATINQLY